MRHGLSNAHGLAHTPSGHEYLLVTVRKRNANTPEPTPPPRRPHTLPPPPRSPTIYIDGAVPEALYPSPTFKAPTKPHSLNLEH